MWEVAGLRIQLVAQTKVVKENAYHSALKQRKRRVMGKNKLGMGVERNAIQVVIFIIGLMLMGI
jgi:hypothetical protein